MASVDVGELCGAHTNLEQLGIPTSLFETMVRWRRALHRQPELAFHETQTAAFVRAVLRDIEGVSALEDPIGGTGIVALIEGAHSGRTILLRADMDALPIAETTEERASSQSVEGSSAGAMCCVMCGGPNLPPWCTAVPSAGQQPSTHTRRNVPKSAVSERQGVSHACGHDGHMAMLLGAATLLAARRAELHGRIVLLFQPAEERHPTNNPMGGAIRMIRDRDGGARLASRLLAGDPPRKAMRGGDGHGGVTERERNETDGFDTTMDGALLDGVDEVYGAHLWNYASAGTIGCASGPVTANSDSVELRVYGTGGHASAPQGTVDAVVVAAQLISALQMLVSRNVSPTESAVLTLGKIEGGFAPNVIATEVKILGTMRTFSAPVKALMIRRIHEVSAGIAASHGPRCSIDVRLRDGYPACVNQASCAAAVLEAAESRLGAGGLVGPPTPNMAGEDFTFFLSRKPGAFFFVGSNPHAPFAMGTGLPAEEPELVHGERGVVAHHTPEFDIHEGALAVGTAAWVALALHRLAPPEPACRRCE